MDKNLRKVKARLACSIAIVPLVMALCSAQAATVTGASVTEYLGGNLINKSYVANQVGTGAGVMVSGGLTDSAYSTGSYVNASSVGSPAVVHASVGAVMSSDFHDLGYSSGLNSQTSGNLGAKFSDFITINATGMTGQVGSVTASFLVSTNADTLISGGFGYGSQDTLATIESNFGFALGSTLKNFSGQLHESFISTPVDRPLFSGVYDLTTNFIFGTPFEVKANANFNWSALARRLLIDPRAPHGPSNVLDSEASIIGNTDIYWNGISLLSDSHSNPIAFRLTSDSGFDYSRSAVPVTSVPEPETYAMLLAGLGLIGAIARRRKAQQTA